jgi:hypothetical protein
LNIRVNGIDRVAHTQKVYDAKRQSCAALGGGGDGERVSAGDVGPRVHELQLKSDFAVIGDVDGVADWRLAAADDERHDADCDRDSTTHQHYASAGVFGFAAAPRRFGATAWFAQPSREFYANRLAWTKLVDKASEQSGFPQFSMRIWHARTSSGQAAN